MIREAMEKNYKRLDSVLIAMQTTVTPTVPHRPKNPNGDKSP